MTRSIRLSNAAIHAYKSVSLFCVRLDLKLPEDEEEDSFLYVYTSEARQKEAFNSLAFSFA